METRRRLDDDLTTTWVEVWWSLSDCRRSHLRECYRMSYIHRIYPLFCWQETHSMRSHHHGRHGRHGRVRLFAIAKTFRMHWPLHCRRPGKRKTILIDIVSHTDAFVQIWSAMCVCVQKLGVSKIYQTDSKSAFQRNKRTSCRPSRAFSQPPPHPGEPGCASAIDSSAPRDVRLGSNSDPSPRRSTESYRRCCWSLAAPG